MISSATNTKTNTQIISLFTSLLFLCGIYCCSGKDSITIGEVIRDDEASCLESQNKMFQMGFFPIQKTSEVRRYVGIWYTLDPNTIVWVANRDEPVLDYTGYLTVSEDGNAKLLNNKQTLYFSTHTDGSGSTALKLFDTGNVALIHVASGNRRWQSFNSPTDTFLLGMYLEANGVLRSWKGKNDPGTGSYEFKQVVGKRYLILKDTVTYHWKSGTLGKNSFGENPIFSQALNLLLNTTMRKRLTKVNNTASNETYMVIEPYSRIVMSYTGHIQYFSWPKASKQWVLDWQEPKDICNVYKVCGSFGMCSRLTNDHPSCSCLPKFQPTSARNDMAGCKRTSEICHNTNETFVNITMISIDDTNVTFLQSDNESACIQNCLQNCECQAYSYMSRNDGPLVAESRHENDTYGCWFWNSEPNNIRAKGRHNISFRVSEELKGSHVNASSKYLKLVPPLALVISALVLSSFCGLSYIYYRRLMNRIAENTQHNIEIQSNNMGRSVNELLDQDDWKEDDQCERTDVPYFELESIIAATQDFSPKNKLGQGGFGPVYKGTLPGGQDIAVKRLSSISGQGLQEFKNEVMVIAKLQHRNLVRLLGYCISGEEKLLIYEHMQNRSLDAFIFDRKLSTALDWKKRFNIIMGIARGLSYLHHDSRVRIIHRDLKTSNILLDENMNPKISDFGLARIVIGNDTEAITKRVIGTFGYIAPEYALHGHFSVKSDVFSFGVVLLEIVSGKTNTRFYQSETSTTNLVGQAWSLWIEDKPHELMDQTLMESCNPNEVVKCIIIGLLCVQGQPDDRPTMTNVVLMLGGEIDTLPTPKEPTVVSGIDHSSIPSSSGFSKPDTQSEDIFEITKLDGR